VNGLTLSRPVVAHPAIVLESRLWTAWLTDDWVSIKPGAVHTS
jgi:hypothetical protein